jgi:protoporphyrin/coproporphyrin ferrochelatase
MEPYLTDIRRGHRPTEDVLENLRERYRKIGGRSPLLDISNSQASALEMTLNARGVKARVYVGMKHWHPYIREVIPRVANDGISRIIALALAPHYSQVSTGGYKQALDQALAATGNLSVDFVDRWYDHPLFHRAVAEKISAAVGQFPKSGDVDILFTAHSLPERILDHNDPYPSQLRSSCQSVANMLDLDRWSFAYQSAGQTAEKWLGPDILESLKEISERGKVVNVLVVPIGFVADHLEILYDIDIEAQAFAKAHGLDLRRTESLNTSQTFISALADIALTRASQKKWA